MQPRYEPSAPKATPPPFPTPRTCFLVEGALDAAACASIVDAATRRGFEAMAADYPPGYRDNDRMVMSDAALAEALFVRLRATLPAELEDEAGARLRLVGLNERFRFCRYRGGQSFRIHQDGAHCATDAVRSRLTVQVYLDERFVGGRTRYYTSRRGPLLGAVTPRVGTAIVFDHDLWHDGEAVTEGTKHVLRTDVMYERVDAIADPPETRSTLRGHQGYVFAVHALSDGSLVSGSRDRTVRRWSRSGAQWRCTDILHGHEASVVALAEPLPGLVVSGSRDRTVRAFDTATGRLRVLASLGGAVLSMAKLHDGTFACGASDGRITVLDRDGARLLDLAGHSGWVWALARLPDGRLASASDDGTIRAWDLTSGECVIARSPGRGPVHALAVLTDGRLAAGFADGHVIVYDVGDALDPTSVIAAHDGEINAMLALPDGRLATGGEDARACVLRTDDCELVSVTRCGGFVRSISHVPSTNDLALASYDGTVQLWSPARSVGVRVLKNAAGSVDVAPVMQN